MMLSCLLVTMGNAVNSGAVVVSMTYHNPTHTHSVCFYYFCPCVPALFDAETLAAMDAAADAVAAALASPRGLVIASGSGTSGRLAFFVSRGFNAACSKLLPGSAGDPRFHYLMAGGDAALIKAKEGAEDDPDLALADLTRLVDSYKPTAVVLIGISCSMSVSAVVVVAGVFAWCP